MNPALWGMVTALGWGTADFVARYSGRALGYASALLGMLLVGSMLLTLYVIFAAVELTWEPGHLWLLAVCGIGVAFATLLLYGGLSRGPVTVVAPIVSAYPALVVAIAFALGSRPTMLQWMMMGVILVGVLVVARTSPVSDDPSNQIIGDRRVTISMAIGAAILFAIAIAAGQYATPVYGEVQTLWCTRLISLATMLLFFALPGQRATLPLHWWPLLILQGLLDGGAYLALFAGSHGDNQELAAVTASAFGAVTVILARCILREVMGTTQWAGVLLIFIGVAVLAGT
jgi:drug/metabolite transporter (DMT)-like permease